VNQARQQQNASGSLSRNSDLDAVALTHSQDMASHNSASSTGSDGSTSQSRIQGIRGSNGWWGEFIYWTTAGADPNTLAQQAFNSWDKGTILNSHFTVDGIGVAQSDDGSKIYITIDFSS
jgi:uncharacterized protein YkwD